MSEDQPTVSGIDYTQKQLEIMSLQYSRLKPVEPGDTCCNCGRDCDQEGFAVAGFHAYRINGHPICGRGGTCYSAAWAEYNGRRSGCRCPRKQIAK